MTSLYSSSSAKERPRLLERHDQRVHVLLRVVHVERGSRRRRHPQPPHQDLRAMMSGPHAHPLLIEHLGQVVWMDVLVPEREGATSELGILRAEHPCADRLQSLEPVGSELPLMAPDALHAE